MLCKIPSKIYGYFFEKEKVWKSFVDHVAWEEYFLNPPINYTFKSKADLWHITNYIPDDISHNFVIDLEHPFMLSGDSYNYKKIIENKENIEAKLSSKYCKKAHVFVLPLLQDSFGVYLECLAFGMPMISTGIYDKKEIIFDNYNGLIIKAPYSLLSHDDIFKKWNNWDEFCNYVKNNLDSDFIKQIYQKMEY